MKKVSEPLTLGLELTLNRNSAGTICFEKTRILCSDYARLPVACSLWNRNRPTILQQRNNTGIPYRPLGHAFASRQVERCIVFLDYGRVYGYQLVILETYKLFISCGHDKSALQLQRASKGVGTAYILT